MLSIIFSVLVVSVVAGLFVGVLFLCSRMDV